MSSIQLDVPYSLMVELYSYMSNERNRLSKLAEEAVRQELILNSAGRPFTKGSAIDAFRWISKKVGFRCRPHMLRHTYAVHTLAKLRARRDYKGDPLLYIRDRLGHSSVETTAIYLKQLNQLDASLVLAIESEFDEHFSPSNERGMDKRSSQDPKDAT
jgi:integrase/recombinase XerD